jgi:hypothetical protein
MDEHRHETRMPAQHLGRSAPDDDRNVIVDNRSN